MYVYIIKSSTSRKFVVFVGSDMLSYNPEAKQECMLQRTMLFCFYSFIFLGMASSSNGSHGGDDASRSRRKVPDHLLKYFDPAFVESRSPRNTFVWEHMSEYEQRHVLRVEHKLETGMLSTATRFLRMIHQCRKQEDFITLNLLEGEFESERRDHVSAYNASMKEIRWNFINRSIKYTETCLKFRKRASPRANQF